MRGTGEIEEVEESEDSTVRGAYDGNGLAVAAGNDGDKVAGFEDNIKVQPLEVVESSYGNGEGCRV